MEVAGSDGDSVCTSGYVFTDGTPQEHADKFNAIWSTQIMPLLTTSTLLKEVRVLQRDDGETQSASSFASLPHAGSDSSGPMPANLAVLVQKRSILAGRKHRGRMYIPGIPSSIVTASADPNALEAASLTEFQGRFDALFADCVDSSPGPAHPLVILHTPDADPTVVAALSVQGRFATQRGRLR
jgi:hypothetical protein